MFPEKHSIRKIYTAGLLLGCVLFNTASGAENKQDFSSNDFQYWLKVANVAQATYQSKDDLIGALGHMGYSLNTTRKIPGYSVSFTLATNDATKQHLVAVRGTSNVENIIVDAAFVLVPDKLSGIDIHQGFLLSSRDIFEEIRTMIKPEYTINTVGHSLGGAVALILAMMLDAQNFDVGEVITFGQPKVTNISGARKFSHLDIKRLVTPKDIVPLVPPIDPVDLLNFSIFWHQGTEIVLYSNHQYSVLTGMASMRRAIDFLNDTPDKRHLNNHFMTTYIRHLKNKLDSAEHIDYQNDFSLGDWLGSFSDTTTQ
jgi:hypothetical protein